MRFALTFVLLAACGGGNAENTQTTAPTASASASAAPTASASATTATTEGGWSDSMSKDQQAAYMKAKVVPAMGPVFQAFDGKKYAEFGCKTCHGPAYKVPKDYLPHLTFKDGKLKEAAEKPEMAKFMMEKVTPAMVTAMGAKPFDPQAHTGFGCGGCHTIDMK
jgi:cytochrome c551/c552